MSWWWLSFCDPKKPVGSQFLGVCIVDGDDLVDAIKTAWAAGCNPGGEILSVEMGEEMPSQAKALPHYQLLTREQVEAIP